MKKTGFLYRIAFLSLILSSLLLRVFAVESVEEAKPTLPVNELSACYSADAVNSMLGSQEIVSNAKSIFLYEVNTETLMYMYNPDTPQDPSSLTKIMTALLAVERGQLTDQVVVKQSVLDTVPDDAVSAKLQADEVISLQDLLYCLMVGSANDAAAVIADHIGGSQAGFVQLMNDRAVQLGCTGTNFVNVHGIYHASQTMTARDVAKILAVAIGNESFHAVFTTTHYTVPATNKSAERDLSTGNYLMNTDDMQIYYDSRVQGGRTGIAGDGSRCLAVTAQENGMNLISVIMGAESVVEEDGYTVQAYGGFNETRSLLDAGFSGYKSAQIIFDGQALVQWSVRGGENAVTAGPKATVLSVLPAEADMNNLSFRYDISEESLKAPISAGDKLCTAQIWYGNLCVAKTDLFAMNEVREADFLSQKEQSENPTGFIWLWIPVVVCVLVTITLIFIRLTARFRLRAAKRSSKNHRADRRRTR